MCCGGHGAAVPRARPERLPPNGERKLVREVSRFRWSGFPGTGQFPTEHPFGPGRVVVRNSALLHGFEPRMPPRAAPEGEGPQAA